jgi:hypothetical protein
MSDYQRRRDAPRRNIRSGSRMHPGWACFLLAWGSGMFTVFAMMSAIHWAALKLPFGYVVVTGGIAIALFLMGGKIAERLWDRQP